MSGGQNALPGIRHRETRVSADAVGRTALAPARLEGSSAAADLLRAAVSFPVMLGALLVAGVFVMARQFRIDPDMWWHIKAGDIILTTHHWPTTDPFSFTVVGQPWIACEWLSETLIACVSRIAGIRGLDALLIVLSAAIMIGIYVLGTLRSKNSKAGLLAAAILMPLAAQSFTLRPQMLGLIFLILTLIALELFREGKRNAI